MRKVITAVALVAVCVCFVGVGSTLAKPTVDSAKAVVSVQTAQARVTPGGLVTVDVMLSNADSVSGFQVKIDATGGDQGSLTLEDIALDKSRRNTLFGQAALLETMSPATGELLAIRQDSKGVSVGANEQSYLATATFRVSPDARGTFSINVNTKGNTLLIHSSGAPVKFQAGKAAQIAVGASARLEKRNRTSR